MNMRILKPSFIIILSILLFSSCTQRESSPKNAIVAAASIKQHEESFINALEKHFDAISNRDLVTLKSTLSPEGKMQLLLPGTEIISGVDGFMQYHQDWFQDTSWTLDNEILNSEIGNTIGFAIVKAVYREPERDGVPYFNRMAVSYDLKRIDGKWYIIKDHATSIEKSTDAE